MNRSIKNTIVLIKYEYNDLRRWREVAVKKKGINPKIKKHWRRISLKDKCLIVIMMIIMWQSIYGLFIGEGASQHSGSIDVVIRTTSAAIFGYFLSANFLNKKVPQMKTNNKQDMAEQTTCICTTVKENHNEGKEESKQEKKQELEDTTYFIAQILIAASIGIISLIVLIIARDIPEATVQSVSSLSQFRDFVSGCVGFLIGIPESREHKNRDE